MEFKDRLTQRLKETGLTQSELAKRIGVSKTTITFWKTGVNKLSGENLMALAKALRCSARWLATGEGSPVPESLSLDKPWLDMDDASNVEQGPPISSPYREIKIIGTAQMGTEGYWYALDEADGVVDVPSRDPGAYALRLKGDSMAPAIRSGWIAIVEPNHRLVPLEYVMIRLQDGECMLKELLQATDEEVVVQSVNEQFGRRTIPTDQIETIHYVGHIVAPSKVRV
jgi:phage repressor protein C with HTH and peptisase S24 domain